MVDNLLGIHRGNCTKDKCDPYNAGAAKIVRGDGETTACGKTWGTVADGVVHLAGHSSGNAYNDDETRYEMLKQVPGPYTDGEPDLGGCKGCPYWELCTGGCPGAGEDDDWRERTNRCLPIRSAYEAIEAQLRGTLPNVRLVTDLPWDSGIGDEASRWNADIQPFAAMDPEKSGRASASKGVRVDAPSLSETRYSEPAPSGSAEGSVEETYQREVEAHGEEVVTKDEEAGVVHTDSELREVEPVGTGEVSEDEDPFEALERVGDGEEGEE